MSGFVSRPPLVDADPPAQPAPELVAGDGWFPDVDLAVLRQVARLEPNITAPRLREAAIAAMIEVNRQLEAWRDAQLLVAAYANLAAVPAPQIGGRSRLLALYDRAIAETVAADLAERLADIGATAAGAARGEELRCAADEHRRNARWAVNDLAGKRRSTVELI